MMSIDIKNTESGKSLDTVTQGDLVWLAVPEDEGITFTYRLKLNAPEFSVNEKTGVERLTIPAEVVSSEGEGATPEGTLVIGFNSSDKIQKWFTQYMENTPEGQEAAREKFKKDHRQNMREVLAAVFNLPAQKCTSDVLADLLENGDGMFVKAETKRVPSPKSGKLRAVTNYLTDAN